VLVAASVASAGRDTKLRRQLAAQQSHSGCTQRWRAVVLTRCCRACVRSAPLLTGLSSARRLPRPVQDGNTDFESLRQAIANAKAVTDKPSLIKVSRAVGWWTGADRGRVLGWRSVSTDGSGTVSNPERPCGARDAAGQRITQWLTPDCLPSLATACRAPWAERRDPPGHRATPAR
jgi:hypothetical protein